MSETEKQTFVSNPSFKKVNLACHQLFSSYLSCNSLLLNGPTTQINRLHSPTCSLFCCLCRHPNSKISSYHSTHSEITLLTNNESKSSIQSSCPTHNCIKTGHQSGLHSILSFTIQCFTRSSSLITRNRSSVTSGLKMSNSYNSLTSLLSYGKVFPLTYVTLLITQLKTQ